jgi:hypothetical protein
MPQQIDPIKLKAAAEHLEWVCQQYPDNDDVQGLYRGLQTMIEEAKAGRVLVPVERVPYWYQHADGVYIPYKEPSVGGAYSRFADEMEGGLTEQDVRIIAKLKARMEAKAQNQGENHD